jgi:hypothetical protein
VPSAMRSRACRRAQPLVQSDRGRWRAARSFQLLCDTCACGCFQDLAESHISWKASRPTRRILAAWPGRPRIIGRDSVRCDPRA